MEYISTRSSLKPVSSAKAILTGLADDGGLYLPKSIPQVTPEDIKKMAQMDYCGRAEFILSLFLTDYSADDISSCVKGAYNSAKFDSPKMAPTVKLENGLYVLELWHGPTCAFKDMALQLMPRLFTTAIKMDKLDKTVVILVATSGDTGKAALEGFCDVDGTKIIVFYPADGVSEVQKRQMTTQKGKNTYVVGVNGNFDDCQNAVKSIFSDADLKSQLEQNGYEFSSANSINWGRLVPQIIYYFSSYCDLLESGEITLGEKIDFAVPTGNFGDILAGYIAKRMGLFVNKLVCASNKNNILTDFINTGVYDRNRDFYTTMSPSMDILISSNLERLLFMMSDLDCDLISKLMAELKNEGRYRISDSLLLKLKSEFTGGFANEADTLAAIGSIYKKYNYVIDPHTAVAANVAMENRTDCKMVVLSTANPYKFPKSVIEGVSGSKVQIKNEFELFDILNKTTGLKIPAQLSELETMQERFKTVCQKGHMRDIVKDFLNI